MSDKNITWVELEGGSFQMGNPRGDGYPQDGEEPVHSVTLTPFAIAATTVTNDQFGDFVAETGYTTEAEEFGWSFVFTMFLPEDFEPTRAVQRAEWWRQVNGADWRHPEGPQSQLERRRSVLRLGRRTATDRGRMGIRRARWP